MVDPLSLVGTILTVVQLIGSAASLASQNEQKCLELAERAWTLARILPNFAHAAASDAATALVLERLRDAVNEALRLIQSCQFGGVFSRYSRTKAAELDSVDRRINNCILDLTLISQASRRTTTTTSAYKPTTAGSARAPAQPQSSVHVHYHHRVQRGAASSAHVGWAPPPSPQHAWGAPPAPGYYQQPPGYGQWAPSPGPYYTASSSPYWF